MKYDAIYFIKVLRQIPEAKWCASFMTVHAFSDDSGSVYTHLGNDGAKIQALCRILDGDGYTINDGLDPRYPQKNPKLRIMAALRDAACAGLKEIE